MGRVTFSVCVTQQKDTFSLRTEQEHQPNGGKNTNLRGPTKPGPQLSKLFIESASMHEPPYYCCLSIIPPFLQLLISDYTHIETNKKQAVPFGIMCYKCNATVYDKNTNQSPLRRRWDFGGRTQPRLDLRLGLDGRENQMLHG